MTSRMPISVVDGARAALGRGKDTAWTCVIAPFRALWAAFAAMGSSGKSEQMKYTENAVMNMPVTIHPGDVPGVEPNPGGERFYTNPSTSPLALSASRSAQPIRRGSAVRARHLECTMVTN